MSNPIEMEKKFRVLPSDLDDFLKSQTLLLSEVREAEKNLSLSHGTVPS